MRDECVDPASVRGSVRVAGTCTISALGFDSQIVAAAPWGINARFGLEWCRATRSILPECGGCPRLPNPRQQSCAKTWASTHENRSDPARNSSAIIPEQCAALLNLGIIGCIESCVRNVTVLWSWWPRNILSRRSKPGSYSVSFTELVEAVRNMYWLQVRLWVVIMARQTTPHIGSLISQEILPFFFPFRVCRPTGLIDTRLIVQ